MAHARRLTPRWFARAVLGAYARVVFSDRSVVGAVLLAGTFVVPAVGAWGLAGALGATAAALALGLDEDAVGDGVWGYNSLLVLLVAGATWKLSATLVVLAAVMVPVTVLLQLAFTAALGQLLRLPVLSMPFVVAAWLMALAAPHVRGLAVGAPAAVLDLPLDGAVGLMLRALGSTFALPHAAVGLALLVAVALHSRIALVCALVGWGAAAAADRWLLSFPGAAFEITMGFNLVLTAMALGGVFYVPGWASLGAGVLGVVIAGLVGVGTMTLIAPWGLSVGALPFNLTTLLVLYALAMRRAGSWPLPVGVPASSPEASLHRHRAHAERFGDGVPLRLPVMGAWVCTQGNDGPHTHQGPWRHGVDLEASGADGALHDGDGARLADYHCYGLPVVAPAAGAVVVVRDGLPDQPPGEMDVEHPWGNCVVLRVAPDRYVMLGHLQAGSIAVAEGAVVAVGQALGRCGSSGRAPRPHLHVQLQATPTVGAPTLPLRFRDVVRHRDDGASQVVGDAVPEEGWRVRNLAVDADVAAALSFPVGGRWTYRVRADGGEEVVELRSEVDLLGRHVLAVDGGGRLVVDGTGWSFIVRAIEGPPSPLLEALSVVISRVPYDGADGLCWEDVSVRARVRGSLVAWWLDGVAWLLPWRPLRVAFRQERRGTCTVVTATGGGGLHPNVRARAELVAGVGVQHVEVTIGGAEVRATLEVSR